MAAQVHRLGRFAGDGAEQRDVAEGVAADRGGHGGGEWNRLTCQREPRAGAQPEARERQNQDGRKPPTDVGEAVLDLGERQVQPVSTIQTRSARPAARSSAVTQVRPARGAWRLRAVRHREKHTGSLRRALTSLLRGRTALPYRPRGLSTSRGDRRMPDRGRDGFYNPGMLPASYASAAAAILTFGGLLSCFAGYRLFRFVLGIFGFILGAFITTSVVGTSSMWALVVAAAAGGVLGAVLMVVAYFMGVGLIGAGLAALVLNLGWRVVGGDPPTWLLVIVAVLGALGALSVVRYVVMFGTAIAGAWTLIVGGLAMTGNPAAQRAASAGDVWVLYPLGPDPWRVVAGGAVVRAGGGRRGRAVGDDQEERCTEAGESAID